MKITTGVALNVSFINALSFFTPCSLCTILLIVTNSNVRSQSSVVLRLADSQNPNFHKRMTQAAVEAPAIAHGIRILWCDTARRTPPSDLRRSFDFQEVHSNSPPPHKRIAISRLLSSI